MLPQEARRLLAAMQAQYSRGPGKRAAWATWAARATRATWGDYFEKPGEGENWYGGKGKDLDMKNKSTFNHLSNI